MSIKLRLVAMNFMQFFVWGAWLITIGAYWFQYRHWSGAQFGAIFSTMGIASLFMPSLMGVIADKWLNAEKLYGLLHIGGAVVLFIVPSIDNPTTLFWVMLLNMMCYMPTISLAIAVAYNALKTEVPTWCWCSRRSVCGVRFGFIAAMWDGEPAAPRNLRRPVLRRLRRGAAARPVCVHPCRSARRACAVRRTRRGWIRWA
jgi:Nucleoside H+ symporter.